MCRTSLAQRERIEKERQRKLERKRDRERIEKERQRKDRERGTEKG